MLRLLVVLLVALPAFAQTVTGLRPEESFSSRRGGFEREFGRADGGTAARTVFRSFVVDALSGEPILGAMVQAFIERDYPEPPTWQPVAETTTDVDGFYELVMPEGSTRGAVVFISKPGYATNGEGARRELIPLEPSVPARVAIRDHLDRPVEGAKVALVIGCGHTPDAATTFSGKDGVAALPHACRDFATDIEDLWITKSGFACGYDSLGSGRRIVRPDDPPPLKRLRLGRDIVGRLLAKDGTALAGVVVGNSTAHRGPWTRTAADGRFRLVGLSTADDAWIVIDPKTTTIAFERSPDGREQTLIIDGDRLQAAREPASAVTIAATDAAGAPVADQRFAFVRDDDAFTRTASTNAEGTAAVDLPRGAYDVFVSSLDESTRPRRERFVVDAKEGSMAVVVSHRPTFSVVLPRAIDGPEAVGPRVFLVAEDLEIDVTRRAESGVPVPEIRPLFLRIEDGDAVQVLPLAQLDEATPRRTIVVPPMEPRNRVSGRFVAPDGRPVAARWRIGDAEDLEDWRGDAGTETTVFDSRLDARLSGRLMLVADDADGRFARLSTEIHLPASGDREVDLGALVFRSTHTPLLSLQPPPLDGESEAIVVRRPGIAWRGVVDSTGAWNGSREIGAGDWVVGTGWRTRLEGEGPWTLARPNGVVTVRVLDHAGAPLRSASIGRDGESELFAPAEAVFEGLGAGSHSVTVAADGYESMLLRLRLAAGEKRAIEVRLKRP